MLVTRVKPDLYEVESESKLADGDNQLLTYMVRPGHSCTCPSFQYRHQQTGTACKHMLAVKEHLANQTPLARAAEKAALLTDAQLERYSREHNGSAAGCACLLELACRQRSAEQDTELKQLFS